MTTQEAFEAWCQYQEYHPDDFLRGKMVWTAACAWQREQFEQASITEQDRWNQVGYEDGVRVERERCANVAEGCLHETKTVIVGTPSEKRPCLCGRNIATAIRQEPR